MKFDAEFKQAISLLPSKEKDKLILRLLKRDLVLANQLYFQLLSEESVYERRNKMANRVTKEIEQMTNRFYSPGTLLIDLRFLSGEITEHVKITKDKVGEPGLNLLMLTQVLKRNNERIANAKTGKSYTIGIYIIARVFKILVQIKSLHEDYFVEFEESLIELGNLISDNPFLMKLATQNGLDINWLVKANIPGNIDAIHKEMRARGYLK